jgi:hypothetical protein
MTRIKTVPSAEADEKPRKASNRLGQPAWFNYINRVADAPGVARHGGRSGDV